MSEKTAKGHSQVPEWITEGYRVNILPVEMHDIVNEPDVEDDDDFENYSDGIDVSGRDIPSGKLPDRGPNPYGLPEWHINGVVVYAATRKAAIKKSIKATQING